MRGRQGASLARGARAPTGHARYRRGPRQRQDDADEAGVGSTVLVHSEAHGAREIDQGAVGLGHLAGQRVQALAQVVKSGSASVNIVIETGEIRHVVSFCFSGTRFVLRLLYHTFSDFADATMPPLIIEGAFRRLGYR